jgi:hypothetical protein
MNLPKYLIFLNKFYIFKSIILFYFLSKLLFSQRFCESFYLVISVQWALNVGDHWSKIYISKAGLSFPSIASTSEIGKPFISFLLMDGEILHSSVQYLQTNSITVRQIRKWRLNSTFFLNHSFYDLTSYNVSYCIIKRPKIHKEINNNSTQNITAHSQHICSLRIPKSVSSFWLTTFNIVPIFPQPDS